MPMSLAIAVRIAGSSVRSIARRGLEVVLHLGKDGVEEARRPGVVHLPRLAPLEHAAVLEEQVHQLPQHVVKRLDQLLAYEWTLARDGELPFRPQRAEGDREAAALARYPERTGGR